MWPTTQYQPQPFHHHHHRSKGLSTTSLTAKRGKDTNPDPDPDLNPVPWPHSPGIIPVMATPAAPTRAPIPRPKTASPGPDAPPPAAPRRPNRSGAADPLSDRATALLIRRTLCSQQLGDKARDAQVPIDELLPPLTSRNDMDLQLYALLAIILREFVQSWYSRITADENFVAEIIHIIAHCSRALEQRLRKVDLESLLLDEIPDLLDKHIAAYRTAHRAISPHPIVANPREVYHALCPLPHLTPVPRLDDPLSAADQLQNEALYRQLLVQGVLAILLPTEDLENPCLTALVEQIFSELIIGSVIANKASQPWLLYEGICITARVVREKREQGRRGNTTGATPLGAKMQDKSGEGWSIRSLFLGLIQLGMLLAGSIRFIVTTLAMASSLPPRRTPTEEKKVVTNDEKPSRSLSGSEPSGFVKTPILSFRIWACLGNLIEMNLRMPWLDGFLSLLQLGAVHGPGRMAGLDGPVDRLLSHHIQSLIAPDHLPPLLRTLRGVLFPNNAPGQPSLFPPSSDAELQALRRRAAKALLDLLPSGVGRLYFGGRLWRRGTSDGVADEHESLVDEMEHLLLVLDDEYCNKHLMYSVLELILVRAMPELSEKGVVDLQDERLG